MRVKPPFSSSLIAFTLSLFACAGDSFAGSAEYQWSVPVPGVTSEETHAAPRAYLWIPPNCQRVRAVVLGQHNMLEEPVLEHPEFRAAMADLGIAEVWVTPILGGQSRFDQGEGGHFEEMFRALATESGYTELAYAPVVAIGHSAMAEFPYRFAVWNPQRTLAAISLKGTWPNVNNPGPPPWTGNDVAGVPLLLVSGEYEWADERAGKALPFRRAFPAVPFSMLADAGGGHFDPHDSLARYLALYVRKAAQYHLPAEPGPIDQPVALRPIDATKQGWLIDRWRQNEAPRSPAAQVGKYVGNVRETYWCFDEEQARATEQMQAIDERRKPQLLGYEQNGQVLPQDPKTHQQVTIPFVPDPAGDGLTFKLTGAFLDTVPEGRPVRWAGRPAGSSIGHASGGGPVILRRICGPVEKLGDDTFALRFDRLGFDNTHRSNEIWLLAEHPGDREYKRAVQQAVLHFPLRNTQGPEQAITFTPLPDQTAGTGATIPLRAESSAGPDARVRFYIREGPAELTTDGTALHLTRIPPRARFPMKVTVVAWQWGRSIEPLLQTAAPVERTFLLNSPPSPK